jgi:hypothetical protein
MESTHLLVLHSHMQTRNPDLAHKHDDPLAWQLQVCQCVLMQPASQVYVCIQYRGVGTHPIADPCTTALVPACVPERVLWSGYTATCKQPTLQLQVRPGSSDHPVTISALVEGSARGRCCVLLMHHGGVAHVVRCDGQRHHPWPHQPPSCVCQQLCSTSCQ